MAPCCAAGHRAAVLPSSLTTCSTALAGWLVGPSNAQGPAAPRPGSCVSPHLVAAVAGKALPAALVHCCQRSWRAHRLCVLMPARFPACCAAAVKKKPVYDRKKKQQSKKGGAEEEQQAEPAEAEAAPTQVGRAGQGAACGGAGLHRGRAGRHSLVPNAELFFSNLSLKGGGHSGGGWLHCVTGGGRPPRCSQGCTPAAGVPQLGRSCCGACCSKRACCRCRSLRCCL